MILNKYYIIPLTDINLPDILQQAVFTYDSLNVSVDLTKCVVKMPIGMRIFGYQEFNHKEIIDLLMLPEWEWDNGTK